MTLPVCTIGENGIARPDYADVLAYFEAEFRAIFGPDIYIEPDSQDGQMLAIFAKAVHDCNNQTVAVYNAFSPSTARGTGLSSVVKINGIRRALPTRSSVTLRIVGQAGTQIASGEARDQAGQRWLLPALVTIPTSGEITVTANAADLGNIAAAAGSITDIATPTAGWQSVTNPAPATPGAPVELDAALRRRQTVAASLPSRGLLAGMVAAIADLPGVTEVIPYENTLAATDENGVPGHSVALVVTGGDAAAIAQAIAVKKAPGVRTVGDTQISVTDPYGIPRLIAFWRPAVVQIKATLQVTPLAGFTSTTQAAIRQAIVDHINASRSGDDVILSRLYVPATLSGDKSFILSSVLIGRVGHPLQSADVPIAFNERAQAQAANIAIQILQ